MLKWLLGRKSIEQMIADGECQWAIDTIHQELNQNPPPDRSRDLRHALADALALADRKMEAISVLKDLSRELLKAGQPERAIGIQKKLEKLAPDAPEVGQELDAIASQVPSEARDAVARTPLFSDFNRDELVAVVRGLTLRSYEPGEIVMVEGEPGDSLHLLTQGVVRVYVRNAAGKSVQIREMEGGTFFGEISIVYGKPRTATVSCQTYCEILELDRATVDRIVGTHPRVDEVLKQFCDRRAGSSEEKRARGGGSGT